MATTIQTYINYEVPVEEGGEAVHFPGTVSAFRMKFEPTPQAVRDVRGHESEFTLDRHGFEFHQHESKEKLFDDDERIKQQVYNEVVQLLEEKTGATRVHPFSHIVRRQTFEKAAELAAKPVADREPVGFVTPARYAHVDQSYKGAEQTLQHDMPDDAEELAKKRWGIINVWRPISPISRDPFGACDARSVPEADLFGKYAQLPPKGSGTFEDVSKRGGLERWAVKANPAHKWYYMSNMVPEEVMFVKCYDSRTDVARCSPHSAFVDPATEGETKPRESIEVRCLVFWDED